MQLKLPKQRSLPFLRLPLVLGQVLGNLEARSKMKGIGQPVLNLDAQLAFQPWRIIHQLLTFR